MIARRKARFYKKQLKDAWKYFFSKKKLSGDYINEFEKKFARHIGSDYAISTCSGRFGLKLLLEALGLKPGDEILVPAYTLIDVVKLIQSQGFLIKIIDIEKDSLNIDPNLIEKNITSKTKAVLATHIFGLACDMDAILKIAKAHNLLVIEDCAHALGACYNGKKLGSIGHGAIFSFDFAKNLNTFGGGMVTTNNKQAADYINQKIKSLPADTKSLFKKIIFCTLTHVILISPFYPILVSLFCFKETSRIIGKIHRALPSGKSSASGPLTRLQAYMGLKQLEILDDKNKKRNALARGLNSYLKTNTNLSLQANNHSNERFYYFYVVKFQDRQKDLFALRRKLFSKGIDCGIFSEITDNCAIDFNYNCPVINSLYPKIVQLPIYDDMTQKQIKRIASAVMEILKLQEDQEDREETSSLALNK